MTSKRDLESTIEALKREIEEKAKYAGTAWEKVTELHVFLENILELDPTLDQFRRDGDAWGLVQRDWDIEGVKAAKEFNNAQALAARYSKREEKPAASAVKGRVL